MQNGKSCCDSDQCVGTMCFWLSICALHTHVIVSHTSPGWPIDVTKEIFRLPWWDALRIADQLYVHGPFCVSSCELQILHVVFHGRMLVPVSILAFYWRTYLWDKTLTSTPKHCTKCGYPLVIRHSLVTLHTSSYWHTCKFWAFWYTLALRFRTPGQFLVVSRSTRLRSQ